MVSADLIGEGSRPSRHFRRLSGVGRIPELRLPTMLWGVARGDWAKGHGNRPSPLERPIGERAEHRLALAGRVEARPEAQETVGDIVVVAGNLERAFLGPALPIGTVIERDDILTVGEAQIEASRPDRRTRRPAFRLTDG